MNAYTSKLVVAILAVFIITMVSSVVYHLINQEYITETALYTSVEDSVSFNGVYVRDEEVLTYDNVGVISYSVEDGGKVGKGTTIAEIYSSAKEIEKKQKIDELNHQLALLEKIENPGSSEVAQPANLSNLIAEKYKTTVYNLDTGNIDSITTDKEELLVLLSTMQMVISETDELRASLNQKILDLKEQINDLILEQSPPIDTIISTKSAYFVSHIDGYEEIINKQSVDDFTIDFINSISDDKIVEQNGIIGKIINGYEWYTVGVIDNSKMQYAENDVVRLKFESTSQYAEAKIKSLKSTETPEETIIVLSCDKLIYELVQHRVERVEMIKGEYEGIKVPRKAIRFKELEEVVTDPITGVQTKEIINYRGVYVKNGESIEFKKLDVVYDSDDYVISKLNKTSDYVLLYDDIIVEGVDADGN